MRPFSRPALPAITLVVLICVIPGCAMTPEGLPAASPGSQRAAVEGKDAAEAARLAKGVGSGVFGTPFVLHGTELVLVPYSVVRPQEKSKFFANLSDALSFSSGSWSGGSYAFSGTASGLYQQTSGTHWNNLLVYDKRTGDTRLLLDRRAVIVQALFSNPADARGDDKSQQPPPPPPPQHALLAIAESDTNGDRYINGEDATVLYHVALPTLSLTPISPTGGQFDDITPDFGGRVLYVRSRVDTNGDRKFTSIDDAVIARVDLTSPGFTPIIPDELRKRAFSVIAGRPK